MPNSSFVSIMYVSTSHASREEIEYIVRAASRNNEARGVTGALLWTGKYFVQILEGTQTRVLATLRLISTDRRHAGLRILSQEKTYSRKFGSWGMVLVMDPVADALIDSFEKGTVNRDTFLGLREHLEDLVSRQVKPAV